MLASVGVRRLGWGEGQLQRGALERQPHPLTSDSSQATGPGAILKPLSRDQGLSLLPSSGATCPSSPTSLRNIRWGPRVYPLVTCTVLEDVLLLWLPCLRPLWSHPHAAFL